MMKKFDPQEVLERTGMTVEEIEDYCEEHWLEVEKMRLDLTKDEWIRQILIGPIKMEIRCEQCQRWKCDAILSLWNEYDMIIKVWYEFGCNCDKFLQKTEEL